MRKWALSMFLSFLKNSSMVDRTVLYNDRTVLFKVWRVTWLIFEKISWQKCPFFDRSVLYMSEVSFFLFEKQNCPFHLFFWPEVSFSLCTILSKAKDSNQTCFRDNCKINSVNIWYSEDRGVDKKIFSSKF